MEVKERRKTYLHIWFSFLSCFVFCIHYILCCFHYSFTCLLNKTKQIFFSPQILEEIKKNIKPFLILMSVLHSHLPNYIINIVPNEIQ